MTCFSIHFLSTSTLNTAFSDGLRDRFRSVSVCVVGNNRMSRKWYTKSFHKLGALCSYANRLHAGSWISDDEYTTLYNLGILADAWLRGATDSDLRNLYDVLKVGQEPDVNREPVQYSFSS